jgi:hypothetical protein
MTLNTEDDLNLLRVEVRVGVDFPPGHFGVIGFLRVVGCHGGSHGF